MDLQTRSLTIKVSSLVDKKIIELCVKWSRDPGSVVAVLSPNQKILSSVFIYGKPVRNNTEILFLSGSGEKVSAIAASVLVAQGCGSINLSLPVSFAEISKVSSRRSGVKNGIG